MINVGIACLTVSSSTNEENVMNYIFALVLWIGSILSDFLDKYHETSNDPLNPYRDEN